MENFQYFVVFLVYYTIMHYIFDDIALLHEIGTFINC